MDEKHDYDHTYIRMYVRTCTYISTYVRRYVCVRTYVGTYVHTYIHIYIHIHTYIHICCCLFRCSGTGKRFSNRKETKLSSSAESRIRTQRVSDTYSPADWMPADKPTELSRIKLKTWTRQPVPMISKHSAHLTPLPFGIRTWLWRYTYLLLLILMLWHRQAIFESKGDKLSSSAESRIRTQRVWDTYSPADWMPADKPTELSGTKLKTWTRQPVPMISKHSAHLTPLPFGIHSWLWRYTYLLLLISMLWHRQAIFESKGDKLSSSAESRIRTQRVSDTYSPADWMPADKLTELSRIKLKTLTRQPVPMISKHSAHLTPLPFGIRTWLWRYTYLLLISMLWHRQAIFESKGDKLSSSAEGRIRTQRVWDTYSPADWMPADKPTELSRIKPEGIKGRDKWLYPQILRGVIYCPTFDTLIMTPQLEYFGLTWSMQWLLMSWNRS